MLFLVRRCCDGVLGGSDITAEGMAQGQYRAGSTEGGLVFEPRHQASSMPDTRKPRADVGGSNR